MSVSLLGVEKILELGVGVWVIALDKLEFLRSLWPYLSPCYSLILIALLVFISSILESLTSKKQVELYEGIKVFNWDRTNYNNIIYDSAVCKIG